MPYLIDGHNLIAALPDIDLSDPDDEAKLVLKLRGFTSGKKSTCVVIFDHGLPGGASQLSTRSVEVIFAAARRSNADRLLKQRIRKLPDPRNWTLVTSDREVQAVARARGMRCIGAPQFARELQARSRPAAHTEPPPLAEDEIDEWLDIFGDS